MQNWPITSHDSLADCIGKLFLRKVFSMSKFYLGIYKRGG